MTLTPCQRAFVKQMRSVLADVTEIADAKLLMTWNEAWADWHAACRWAWAHPEERENAVGTFRMPSERPKWGRRVEELWDDYEVS